MLQYNNNPWVCDKNIIPLENNVTRGVKENHPEENTVTRGVEFYEG
jgi:hypothetical protein